MNLLQRLMPYIFLGILLVLFVLGILLFSYILILGALAGLILFVIQWVRDKLSKTKQPARYSGRTFDHKK